MVKFSTKIHRKIDLVKVILGFIEHYFFKKKVNTKELIVLNYHGVPLKFLENFEKQIEYLSKNYSFINPLDFSKIFRNCLQTSKPKLLITFDDCPRNILRAIDILENRNIKSILFIVPNYIDSNEPEVFYKKNIRPNINYNIENKKEDFEPVPWEYLKKLISKKNLIGSHSLSHIMNVNSKENEINNEVILSKKIIEKKLGIKLNHFCSINNSLKSLNKYAVEMIKENYEFHHTTISGKNIQMNKLSIKRINVEAYWNKYHFIFSLGSIENYRWRKKRNIIDLIMK
ncbi:polysaccharide deacetylase family protein [Bacteroidota bacterium]|nr:polysaccharide deacetylase family protein [Bacteroidota bacterium]